MPFVNSHRPLPNIVHFYWWRKKIFYHGFADLLRHIRVQSILRAHFALIRCTHRQINARVRLAYRLVII